MNHYEVEAEYPFVTNIKKINYYLDTDLSIIKGEMKFNDLFDSKESLNHADDILRHYLYHENTFFHIIKLKFTYYNDSSVEIIIKYDYSSEEFSYYVIKDKKIIKKNNGGDVFIKSEFLRFIEVLTNGYNGEEYFSVPEGADI